MGKEIVLIEWLDSKGLTQWELLDEIKPMPPCVCFSVGFLFDDNEEYKTILMTSSENQILGRLTIPSVAIKSIKKLRAMK